MSELSAEKFLELFEKDASARKRFAELIAKELIELFEKELDVKIVVTKKEEKT